MGDIYCGALVSSDYLAHHGVKGMRWGIRRYQREDGSLTSAGKKQKLKNERKNEETRKAVKENRHDRAARASQRDADDLRRHGYIKEADAVQKVADKQREKAEKARARKEANRKRKNEETSFKKVNNFKDKVKSTKSSGGKAREYAVRGAKVAGTVLVAYGVYKAAKAYKKWSNTPYYDSIGNYVNPKMSGSRSAKDLVRTAYTKATGKAHYDAIGNYVEGRKSENSRYKERSRNYDALGNYYNKKYWNDRYKKRAAEMAKKKRR